MYIRLRSICFRRVVMFRLIRISLVNCAGCFRMCSVKGRLRRSYSHCAPSRLLVTVSSAENRFSPLKLYGLLGFSHRSPSCQMLCFPRMWMIAWRAVHFVSFLFPVMSFGSVSPNSTRSFRYWITCSSWIVRVFVSTCSVIVFTRQMIPAPGSVSSFTQSLIAIAGASGPTVTVALLFRSSRFRAMLSAWNLSRICRLCPFNRIIQTAPCSSRPAGTRAAR